MLLNFLPGLLGPRGAVAHTTAEGALVLPLSLLLVVVFLLLVLFLLLLLRMAWVEIQKDLKNCLNVVSRFALVNCFKGS